MRIPKSILTTIEGLAWAVVGGASTSLLEIRQYMTNWKEFDIDWSQVARLAGAGAVLGGAMFLRELAQRRNVAIAAAAYPPGVYPLTRPMAGMETLPGGGPPFNVAMGGGGVGSMGGQVIPPAKPQDPRD